AAPEKSMANMGMPTHEGQVPNVAVFQPAPAATPVPSIRIGGTAEKTVANPGMVVRDGQVSPVTVYRQASGTTSSSAPPAPIAWTPGTDVPVRNAPAPAPTP